MTNEIEIGPYVANDHLSLLSLWKSFFNEFSARALEERWSWQFNSNPYVKERSPVILLARQANNVVGHISAIPLPVILNGDRTYSLFASGLVTDEEHRWCAMRLFSALSKTPPLAAYVMMKSVEKMFSHFGAEPIPLSFDRFTFRIRYDGEICRELRKRLRRPMTRLLTPRMAGYIYPIWNMRKKLERKKVPAIRPDPRIRELKSFNREYDDLWKRVRHRFRCTVDKDATYMNWRYFLCPTLTPYCYGSYDNDGDLAGVIVGFVRAERDWTGRKCVKYGEIGELIHIEPSSSQVESLILAAMNRLDRERVDAITATGLSVEYHGVLQQIGFDREVNNRFSMSVNLSGKKHSRPLVLERESWYYSAADGDTLYATAI
mgnify:FL=1